MSDNQPIDLEELTRLHELSKTETNLSYRPHGVAFNVALLESFPALRAELVTARKNNKDLIQDSCDAQEAAIECAKSFGVCIDNGPGYGEPNIFQLLEDIQKAGETMREELVRLRQFEKDAREVNNALHREKGEARQAIEKMECQLDEARRALQRIEAHDGPGFPHGTCAKIARAFLASLAGREDDVVIFDRDGSRTRKQPEQPTQGEVKVLDLERTPGTVFCKPTNPL